MSNVWFEPDTGFTPKQPVTCKADGNPRPTVHWIRTSDNETVTEGPELVINSTYHSYVCWATNIIRGRTYTVISAEVNFTAVKGTVAMCNAC